MESGDCMYCLGSCTHEMKEPMSDIEEFEEIVHAFWDLIFFVGSGVVLVAGMYYLFAFIGSIPWR